MQGELKALIYLIPSDPPYSPKALSIFVLGFLFSII